MPAPRKTAAPAAQATPAPSTPSAAADVFLIHPTAGHVVHVTAERALELDPFGEWSTATPEQITAAGLAG